MKKGIIRFGKFLWAMFVMATGTVILYFGLRLYPVFIDMGISETWATFLLLVFNTWAVYFMFRGVKYLKDSNAISEERRAKVIGGY